MGCYTSGSSRRTRRTRSSSSSTSASTTSRRRTRRSSTTSRASRARSRSRQIRKAAAADTHKPRGKYTILTTIAEKYTHNIGYPGTTNAAMDEVFSKYLIPQMFAQVSQGKMSAADSVQVDQLAGEGHLREVEGAREDLTRPAPAEAGRDSRLRSSERDDDLLVRPCCCVAQASATWSRSYVSTSIRCGPRRGGPAARGRRGRARPCSARSSSGPGSQLLAAHVGRAERRLRARRLADVDDPCVRAPPMRAPARAARPRPGRCRR